MADSIRVLDHDGEGSARASHARLGTAPARRQAGLDPDPALDAPDSEHALDAEPPGPGRRTRVPGPAAAPDMRRDAGHVRGQNVGLDPVVLRRLAIGRMGDRIEQSQHAVGAIRLTELDEGPAEPGGRVGVLSAVLAYAGRVGLDVARITQRLVEGRPEQPDDSILLANEHLLGGRERLTRPALGCRGGEHTPRLRDRVDAALLGVVRAPGTAIVIDGPSIPSSVPTLGLDRPLELPAAASQLRGQLRLASSVA